MPKKCLIEEWAANSERLRNTGLENKQIIEHLHTSV